MNKVVLMGRLTADPELRQTQSGISACRFTVAVNRKKTKDGKTDADFITCVAWRQTAEFVSKYFRKGSMIALDGTLRTGSYKDRNHADVTHYTTEVYVESVYFTGEKNNTQPSAESYAPPPTEYQPQNQNTAAVPQDNTGLSYGSLSDFEEILSGGDVPF